jgi:predicted DNA-binding WGR domain protein
MGSEKQEGGLVAPLVAQFRAHLRLTSVDPARNRRRFYALTWQPTLWGEWALIHTWGRIGTAGRSKPVFYGDPAGAKEAVAQVIRRRLRRGYRAEAVR